MPVTYGNIAGQEPSTVTFKVGTVTISRGSTAEQQEILVIGDPQTSNALARVIASPPASTEFASAVRIVSGPSSVADFAVRSVLSSTSTDNPVSASQVGTWNIGTVTTVSSLAGIVAVRPSDTNWASSAGFHFNSSGELLAVVSPGNSTIVSVSTLAGRVAIAGYHQSGSLVNVTDSTNNAINVNVVAGAAGGSTIVTVSQLQAVKRTWAAKSSVTVTLASLGNTNRRETTAFFSTAYSDYVIRVNTKGTTASSAYLNVYVYESLGDTTYTGTATGTDAAYSTAVPLSQLRFLGSVQMTTTATPCIQTFRLSDIMACPPSAGGLVFDNQSGGTLSSTSADHDVSYQGIT